MENILEQNIQHKMNEQLKPGKTKCRKKGEPKKSESLSKIINFVAVVKPEI